MLKKVVVAIAKSAARSALSLTPDRILGSAALHMAKRREFAERFGGPLIAELAPRLGIDGLLTAGKAGPVISAPNDTVVFAHYAKNKTWAEPTNRLFYQFFSGRKNGTDVDIGANIGLTLLQVAQFADISCVALEPEPTNFANLTMNVRLNCPYNDVVLHQIAAFDREATVDMTLSNYNLGDHRLRPNGAKNGGATVNVRATPLDLLLPELQGPVAVKIDTQGAEPFVIDGARQVLEKTELLLMEWWPSGIRKMGGDPERAIDFIRKHFKALRAATSGLKDATPPQNRFQFPEYAAKCRVFVRHGNPRTPIPIWWYSANNGRSKSFAIHSRTDR